MLGSLPGGSSAVFQRGISFDGSFTVGRAHNRNGDWEAFLWSKEEGMIGLGDLPGGPPGIEFFSEAWAVSDDGSVVVGESHGHLGDEAFIWTRETGMRSISDLIIEQGDDVSHWEKLDDARAISSDGSIIVGSGFPVDGGREAYLATIKPRIRVLPDSMTMTRLIRQPLRH